MKRLLSIAVLAVFISTPAMADFADVLFVVDESGSMSGEHSWLGSMVTTLDSKLNAAGVTNNRYGLVGFGTGYHGGGSSQVPHTHLVGGAAWGSAADLASATGGLVASGGYEDGWRAIDFGLDYSFRQGAKLNVVLVTDEDRDSTIALTYNDVLSSLNGVNALLNVVVNATLRDATGASALGVDSDGNAYLADGSGGYTTSSGGYYSK